MYKIYQGFDTAVAPPVNVVRDLVKDYNMDFIGAYIGGPYSGGSGYTKQVLHDYRNVGLKHVLPIYVGQQQGGVLTFGRGMLDGSMCLPLLREWGYNYHAYVALDVEEETSRINPQESVEYANGFCERVNHGDSYPGIYGSPYFLEMLQGAHSSASFIWLADWVNKGYEPKNDPQYAGQESGLSLHAWSKRRVWQYQGGIELANYNIDLNVANFTLTPLP